MLTGSAGSVNSAQAGGCLIHQPPACARDSDTGLKRSDLETELHRHLNLSRRRAEEQARNHACARVADGVARRGELGMIERVEELEFELVLEAFAEASHLDERKVYVRLSRRAQDVAPGVAVGPRVVRRLHERVQIEPAINGRIVELARRDPVRADNTGTYGNSGRNILRAPGQANVDFSLVKVTRFRERFEHQLKFEFFNAFNHAQFAAPGNTLGNASAGVISSLLFGATARQIQVAMKLSF